MRKTTFFEKAILLVGIVIAFMGAFIFSTPYIFSQSQVIIVVLLWLILLALIILMAIGEDVKEEIAEIVKDQSQEIRVLKEISHDQLTEIRLLTEIALAEKKNLPLPTVRRVKEFQKRIEQSEKLRQELINPK